MTRIANKNDDFCGKVPLHQTNLIQPHGVLLVVDHANGTLLQASENTEAVFGLPANQIAGQSIFGLLSDGGATGLQELFGSRSGGKLPFSFQTASGAFLALVQQHSGYSILEIELPARTADDRSFLSVYQPVKKVMAALEVATTSDEISRVAARELKQLSGFDKVMVYRFDESWNGDVIAEEKEEGMDSYLGLKFPASDIPPQARELYKKAPYRLIPNINYEPVRLYPVLNPHTGGFTNLSDSNLRSVAAVHLEYLRNMEVTASMSTRILKNGVLWGLIACHHRSPMYLSFEMCSVFELLSNFFTAKIESLESEEIFSLRNRSGEQMVQLVQKLYSHSGPHSYKELLAHLLSADGIAVVDGSSVATYGTVPDEPHLQDLVYWLQVNEQAALYHQPSLASVYEPAEGYASNGSGLLALPVDKERGNFILAFRTEAVRKISWGGNPGEAVQFESNGRKYHPRASFRIWQETVRHTAIPWKPEELEIAERVRNFFLAFRNSNN